MESMSKRKRIFKHYTVKQGWPKMLRYDCDAFSITFAKLAEESKISRYRISSISNEAVKYEKKSQKMEELTRLTEAFNRIIEGRNKKPLQSPWEW